jgi:hypothetical protein
METRRNYWQHSRSMVQHLDEVGPSMLEAMFDCLKKKNLSSTSAELL